MARLKLIIVLFTAFMWWGSFEAWCQTDTEFWFVAPEVWAGHGDAPIVLRFATLDAAATVTVSQPANAAFPVQTLNIAANGSATLDLTPWMGMVENKPVNTILSYGLHITSTADITAYYEVNHINNPDIFTLKGNAALGTEFYTPFQTFLSNNYNESKSGLDLVATEDGTSITITPTQALAGYAAGIPFTITLDQGETFSLRAASVAAANHPAGTHITSSAPIAITMSDDSIVGSPYGGTCFDLLGDQLIPVSVAGTEYIAIKGPALNGPDKVFILATEDGTDVFINGIQFSTLNAGETYTHSLLADVAYYTTSAPVVVLHLTGVSCEVAGAILPPLICTGSDEVAFVRSTNADFALNLLVQSGAEGGFTFNGNPAWIPAANFTAVPGTGGSWLYCQITATGFVPNLQSSRVANSLGRFHLGTINGSSSSYARYGYFSDFRKYYHQTLVSDDELCAGESVTLSAEEIVGATYEWTGPGMFNASTAVIELGPLTLDDAGDYIVSGFAGECPIEPDTLTLVIVPGPDAPLVEYADIWCPGSEITLTGTGSGETWTWTGPSGNLDEDSNTLTVAEPGVYSATNQNGNCISIPTEVNLEFSSAEVVQIADNQVPVCEGSDWYFTLSSLGEGDWVWTGPNAFESAGPALELSAVASSDNGWYVLGGESGGCEVLPDSIQLVVIEPIALALTVPDLACSSELIALQSDDPFGGTWESDCGGCIVGNEFSAENAGEGVWTVTYTSASVCEESETAELEVLPTPSAEFNSPLDACLGQGDVPILALNGGGTWSADCGECLNEFGVFNTATAGEGIWNVTYALDGLCPNSETGTFEVTPNASSSFTSVPVACVNANPLVLLADVAGGTWTSSCGTCLEADGTFAPGNAGVGSVEVAYTIPGACGSSTSNEINVLPLPDADFTLSPSDGCAPLWVDLSASGATGNASCSWGFTGNGENSTESWACGEASHVFNAPGCYDITHAVTDNNGCTQVVTLEQVVCVSPSPSSNFTYSPAQPEWADESVDFSATAGPLPNVSYSWSLDDASTSNGPEWSAAPSEFNDSPWYVCLSALDDLGCESTTCTNVSLASGMSAYAPNAFTPDSDGMNDAWRVVLGGDVAELELTVFDRWGVVTFYTTELAHWWDGRVRAGTHYAPNDVYLWRGIVRDSQGNARRISGHVTLIR